MGQTSFADVRREESPSGRTTHKDVELSHAFSPFARQQPRFLTGLVGRNILASRSPWLHESEADAQGVRMAYSLFDFNALGRADEELGDLLAAAQSLGFAGLNITFPYKQAVIEHLDALSPGAQRLGAVNTVSFVDGKATGHNTDVIGFSESLGAGLPNARLDRVMQFGAGGAGSATAHALLERGAGQVSIFDSDSGRRSALVAKLRTAFGDDRAVEGTDVDAVAGKADGLVNATPMGMITHPGSPIDPDLIEPRHWVSDIVYFPLETELLRQARLKGCATLDGGAMAVLQAAAAFDIFTGLTADRERMLRRFVDQVSRPDVRAA